MSIAGASSCNAVMADRVSTVNVALLIGAGAGAIMSTMGVGGIGGG